MLIYSRALSPEERIQHELENKDWPELLKVCNCYASCGMV
jgi:hypothetical protein